VSDLPYLFQNCDPGVYTRDSAWWAFNFVANWAAVKYSYMRKDIENIQEAIEVQELSRIASADIRALEILSTAGAGECTEFITGFCDANADSVVNAWWDFADLMIVKYDDGYINTPGHMAHEVGYPEEWLNESGWLQGPTSYFNSQEN